MKYTPRTEKEFFRKNILENSYIKENIQLLEKWYNTDEDRENIAQQLGIPLGKLLKIFNHTAPISRKHFFQWRNYKFSYTEMWGLVDDYWGDRFGKFGTPVTLRIYFENSTLIPMEMFHLADWNFMSADEDGYLGYIYGSKEENTLWLSGLQSDFCQRYSWLFQKRGIREIRCGLQKKTLDNLSLIEKYKPFIPILRKAFQREWIIIFLLGICTWMNNTGAIRCAIHQFPLTPGESSKGTFMKRIYRGLPEKIKGEYISLSSGCGGLRYYVMDFDDILGYLRHLNKNFKF